MELNMDEVLNDSSCKTMEEKQFANVTSSNTERTDRIEAGSLLGRDIDAESLETVQKYASRIKSFLGWEPLESDAELVKERSDSNEQSDAQKQKECRDKVEMVEEKDVGECIEAEGNNKKNPEDSNSNHLIYKQEIVSVEENNTNELSPLIGEVTNYSTQDTFEVSSDTGLEDDDENLGQIDSINVNNDNTMNHKHETKTELFSLNDAEEKSNETQALHEDVEVNSFQVNNEKEKKNMAMDFEEALKPEVSEEKGTPGTEINALNIINDETFSNLNASLSKYVNTPYVENIKRLSLNIVRDVVESARNSIHGMTLSSHEGSKSDIAAEAVASDMGFTGFKIDNDKYLETTFRAHDKERKYSSECNVAILRYRDNEKDIIAEDTSCDFGCYKLKSMQKYATLRVFVVLFSIVGAIHGTYDSYFVTMISTLDKRFSLDIKVNDGLFLVDKIIPLFLGIPIGYIGGKTHRPRVFALGILMLVACCFITAVPYFIYGPATYLDTQDMQNASYDICDHEMKDSVCDLIELSQVFTVRGLFLFASFLKGFATLSYYIIGISYLDDNGRKKDIPLYLAVALALRLLGPLLGFLMSSGFLKLYENPLEDPGFGPEDPRWVGAWWMGFVVQGILLLIFTIPIALFPKKLPSSKKLEEKVPQEYKETWREMISGLLSALKRMAKNPIFIFKTINTIMIIFGHFGYAIMLPKYMENQFRISASDASLFSGATSIACIMVSTIFGGFLIWKFKPNAKLLLAGMVASEIVLFLGYIMLMIPHCEEIEMLHFGKNDNGLILNSVCNQNCSCSTTSFTPFCGSDGKTMYFSPCFAGCTEQLESHENRSWIKEFGHCKCVATDFEGASTKITEGFCVDENCWAQAVAYICLMLISVTMNNILTVAHTMILLRSIHPSDKSVALGTYETFACLFGFIPFPITFGALVDSACLVWEENCGDVGNCWFYDMNKYNYLLHGGASIFSALSVVCLITLYCFSSRVRNLYKDDGEAESNQLRIRLDTVSECITKL